MRYDVHILPEDETEVEFLEMLTDAREYALDNGMEPGEAGAVMGQFAAGLFQEGAVHTSQDKFACPDCEADVDGVEATGIGEPPTLEPCGCQVPYEELPPELYLDE